MNFNTGCATSVKCELWGARKKKSLNSRWKPNAHVYSFKKIQMKCFFLFLSLTAAIVATYPRWLLHVPTQSSDGKVFDALCEFEMWNFIIELFAFHLWVCCCCWRFQFVAVRRHQMCVEWVYNSWIRQINFFLSHRFCSFSGPIRLFRSVDVCSSVSINALSQIQYNSNSIQINAIYIHSHN